MLDNSIFSFKIVQFLKFSAQSFDFFLVVNSSEQLEHSKSTTRVSKMQEICTIHAASTMRSRICKKFVLFLLLSRNLRLIFDDFCSFVCHFLSIDIDDCHNHTCQNGASCVDGVNDYSCTCVIGFTGSSCKIGKW